MKNEMEDALSLMTSAVHILDRDARFSEFQRVETIIRGRQSKIFHSDCADYPKNQITSNEPCRSFQQHGTVLTGITFATLHVNLMMELLRMSPMAGISMRRKRLAEQTQFYVQLLYASYDEYITWREANVECTCTEYVEDCCPTDWQSCWPPCEPCYYCLKLQACSNCPSLVAAERNALRLSMETLIKPNIDSLQDLQLTAAAR